MVLPKHSCWDIYGDRHQTIQVDTYEKKNVGSIIWKKNRSPDSSGNGTMVSEGLRGTILKEINCILYVESMERRLFYKVGLGQLPPAPIPPDLPGKETVTVSVKPGLVLSLSTFDLRA